MDPILLILIASSGAALASAAGVLPLFARPEVPRAWIGWSDALAAGMMLGLSYLLSTAGLDGVPGGLGAFLGILFIFVTQGAIDSSPEPSVDGASTARSAHQIFLQGLLHSASEGVAIAAAWAADTRFGVFMALAVAVHNIPEGTLLAAAHRQRGVSLLRAMTIVISANVTQILLAVATYAVIVAAPAAMPWAAGFAAGALVHLVMAELLPDSYRYAGATSIAMVTAIAMGIVVLGGGTLL